jgi:hypothetical protein
MITIVPIESLTRHVLLCTGQNTFFNHDKAFGLILAPAFAALKIMLDYGNTKIEECILSISSLPDIQKNITNNKLAAKQMLRLTTSFRQRGSASPMRA